MSPYRDSDAKRENRRRSARRKRLNDRSEGRPSGVYPPEGEACWLGDKSPSHLLLDVIAAPDFDFSIISEVYTLKTRLEDAPAEGAAEEEGEMPTFRTRERPPGYEDAQERENDAALHLNLCRLIMAAPDPLLGQMLEAIATHYGRPLNSIWTEEWLTDHLSTDFAIGLLKSYQGGKVTSSW